MVKNTLIVKETELVDLITTTATNIIREQDIDWPDPTSLVSIKDQIAQTGEKVAMQDVFTFAQYWYRECAPYHNYIKDDHTTNCYLYKMSQQSRDYYNRNANAVASIFAELNKEVWWYLQEYIEAMPYTSREKKGD